MKNETKTNKNGGKPLESKLRELFEASKRIHIKMILNPFFTNNTSKANGRGEYLASLEEDLSSESSNSDASSSGSVGSRESFEKKDRPPVRYWSTKAVNRQCLKELQKAIDKKVFATDRDMRDNY